MSDEVSRQYLIEQESRWLFRGVFLRSPDDDWLRYEDEIVPLRPDRVGPEWRDNHRNDDTETAYTSWSTHWETARLFGDEARDDASMPGVVVVFRVQIHTLTNRVYFGRADEDEYLIEGRVCGVEISTGLEEEDREYE